MKLLLAIFYVLHLVTSFSNSPIFGEQINQTARDIVPREDVTFRLWTRDQTDTYVPLLYGHLEDQKFIRPNNPVKIFIHGWGGSADDAYYKYHRTEYLQKGDYNIIEVDWNIQAAAGYPLSAGYIVPIAVYIGELIVDLHETLGVPFENIHLIGHSLGAHAAGFAGNYVFLNKFKFIGRITGLDPALPLFYPSLPINRLSSDDAKFVDVIHTDAGKFGYPDDIGHVDFYPNGGDPPQPGCTLRDIVGTVSCSHSRAHFLFGESINSKDFIAKECLNYMLYYMRACTFSKTAIMGENVNSKTKGKFFLTTNDATPFARKGVI